MRIVEFGVLKVARLADIKDPKPSWRAILSKLDKLAYRTEFKDLPSGIQPHIDLIKKLLPKLHAIQHAWRNKVSHVEDNQANQAKACLTVGGQIQIVVPVNNGVIAFPIQSVNSGTSMLGFFPFTGNTPPTPPGGPGTSYPAQTTDYYAVVRCLGFDNALLSLPDDQITWANTYAKVLQCYNLIYPEMSRIRDLSNLNVVKGMAEQILASTKYPANFGWTMFMPVTREMSAGKRNLLQRFCAKVINNEPV